MFFKLLLIGTQLETVIVIIPINKVGDCVIFCAGFLGCCGKFKIVKIILVKNY